MEEYMMLNNDDGWPWTNTDTANAADALNDIEFEDEVLVIIRDLGGDSYLEAAKPRISKAIEKRMMDEYRRCKAGANPLAKLLIIDPRELDIRYDELAFWYARNYEMFDDPYFYGQRQKAVSSARAGSGKKPVKKAPAKKPAKRTTRATSGRR